MLPFHSGPHTQLRESDTQVLTESHEQGGQHTDQGGRREPVPNTMDTLPRLGECAGDARRAAGGVRTAT